MQGKAERGGSIEVWRSGGKKYPSNQKCGGRCDKENQTRQWNEEGLTQNTGKTRQVSGFKWLDESLCFGVTETQHHHVAVWMHCVEVIFMQLAEMFPAKMSAAAAEPLNACQYATSSPHLCCLRFHQGSLVFLLFCANHFSFPIKWEIFPLTLKVSQYNVPFLLCSALIKWKKNWSNYLALLILLV